MKTESISLSELYEQLGDEHILTTIETPMREDAFSKTDAQKIEEISFHFEKIMETLGLDLTDDSLKGTPYRVAKMYVQEIFSGLNPENKPKIALFENKYQYNQMLVEKIFPFTAIASIISFQLWERHTLPTYQMDLLLVYPN